MKRVIALILAFAMIFSVGMCAFAEQSPNSSTITESPLKGVSDFIRNAAAEVRDFILNVFDYIVGLFEIPEEGRYKIGDYPASPDEFSVEPDNSIPFYAGEELLSNPDRGYRGELYITLGRGVAYPSGREDPYDQLENSLKSFAHEDIKLFQLYVYLTDYYDKRLDDKALDELRDYLSYMRDKGLRVLLRFAYEYEGEDKSPTTTAIVRNCRILKKWMHENEQLVNETVYAMQLGTIGYWGEGHSNRTEVNTRIVVAAVFDMAPDGMTVMVRTPEYLSLVGRRYEKQASLHDDFLVGIDHSWGMLSFQHPDYPALLNKSSHSLTDGEMPWGRDTTVPVIDPILFLTQCKNYGLRTLSAEHNYKEGGNAYHLERWKSVMLSPEELEKHSLPYFAPLFEDGSLSVFDYLNYHLGYLLAASRLEQSEDATSFKLYNFGMGAPIDFKIEILTDSGVISPEWNAADLTRFSFVDFKLPHTEKLAVRLTHIRDSSLTIRLANDLPEKDGFFYILGEPDA